MRHGRRRPATDGRRRGARNEYHRESEDNEEGAAEDLHGQKNEESSGTLQRRKYQYGTGRHADLTAGHCTLSMTIPTSTYVLVIVFVTYAR